MATEIRCSSCGRKCSETDSYCRNCHEPVMKFTNDSDLPIDGIEIEKWEEFIGDKSKDYIEVFRKNDGKEFFISAHLGALLFGQFWMFYRKMYKQAVITQLIGYVFIFCMVWLIYVNWILALYLIVPLSLAYRAAICMFANALYKAHVKKKISKPIPNMDEGGTSFAAAAIGYVALGLVSTIVNFVVEILIYRI